MPWFYLEEGAPRGPFNDAEFEALVGSGKIQASTLVRSDETSTWRPFASSVEATSPTCGVCGGAFHADELVDFGGTRVCARCKPTQLQRLREGAAAASSQAAAFAGFWMRGLALAADAVLLIAVSLVISLATGTSLAEAIGLDESAVDSPLWTVEDSIRLGVDLVIGTAYETLFIATLAATPGKLLCRIRVYDANGRRLTMVHALARSMAEWISILPCGAGYLLAAFDKEKRALHDFICNTRVVRAPKK